MKQKGLDKTFIMISKLKTLLFSMVYIKIFQRLVTLSHNGTKLTFLIAMRNDANKTAL